MSKLDEKQIEKTHKSAAGQEDKAFEEWVSQRVLDETAEMINGLENDPDLDDFEPSEELFQKIVGIAKASWPKMMRQLKTRQMRLLRK